MVRKNEIIPEYSEKNIHGVVLSHDTDAFEFQRKPPVDWQSVIKELEELNCGTIVQIKARHSIEDWFLYDIEGILRHLHLMI